MAAFPLQEELINAVIRFVNLELQNPKQVREIFRGPWQPTDSPDFAESRRIQLETRQWLERAVTEECAGTPGNVLAMVGFDAAGKPIDSRGLAERRRQLGVSEETPIIPFHGGIRFIGCPGYNVQWDGKKVQHTITWSWSVSEAPLRAVCGLGVSSIYQAGLANRVGVCARPECLTIFIDRKSRGIRRKFCLETECEKKRNIERVKRSRKKK